MRVLMTETVTPRARDAARSLTDAGHEVHSCHDDARSDATCTGFRHGSCPLEHAPVDLAITVRPVGAPRPTPLEDGARCAVRRKVPTGGPWVRWEHLAWPGTGLADPVARAAEAPLAEHSWVATRALRRSYLRSGLPFDVTACVVRRHALREIDPWARGIDVLIARGDETA